MEVSGVFLVSLARACVNLRVVAGAEWEDLFRQTVPNGWYQRELFTHALDIVHKRFRSAEPILERIGFEMMRLWYDEGPGRSIVQDGREFLRFQASSTGYRSLVRGADDEIGAFVLEQFDADAGTATVTSSTPFPRALERGVLLGGIQLGGEVDFVAVTNDVDPSHFAVVFR